MTYTYILNIKKMMMRFSFINLIKYEKSSPLKKIIIKIFENKDAIYQKEVKNFLIISPYKAAGNIITPTTLRTGKEGIMDAMKT